MKRSLLVLMIAALLAAACGTAPPNATQWCFRFKFAYDTYGFGMAHGSWVAGIGFETDDLGDLAITYVHPVFVSAQQVILHVARTDTSSPSSIDVTATADIFGLASGTLSNSLPSIINEIDLPYTAANAAIAGKSVNINAHQNHADEPLALEYLEIRGNDVNPFGTNNCDGSTPTPSPLPASATPITPSPSPTGTLPSPTPSETPTETETPSNTPTPSPTPSGVCEVIGFDGTDTLNWNYIPEHGDQGAYSLVAGHTGLAFEPGQARTLSGYYQNATQFSIDVSNLTGIYSMSWWYRQTGTDAGEASTQASYLWAGTDYISNPFSSVATGNRFHWADNTWQQEVLGSLSVGGNNALSIYEYWPDVADLRMQIDDIEICHTGYLSTPTPSPTPSGATNTPTLTPSRTNTVNPLWTLTHTPRPLGTALTGTPSRTPSRTSIPLTLILPPTNTYVLGTLPPPATAYATVTPAASYTPNATLTYEYVGTITATYAGTGTPGATGTPYSIPWPTSQPGPGNGTPGSGDGGEIANDGKGALSFVTNAFQQALGWLGELRFALVSILSDYTNAPVQSLPGVPQCATDRLGSELCAIYYILDNTLFAGPVGSLIIPFAVIDIDILIFFTFIFLIRAILARLKEILPK